MKHEEAVEIQLSKYVTVKNRSMVLDGYQKAQKIAKELDIKSYVGKSILLTVPSSLTSATPSFLRGILSPLIRAQGSEKTCIFVSSTNENMCLSLSDFWEEEDIREAKREKEKARKEGLGKWSKPMPFLIPDIGTVIRLKEDWKFRLHTESRNNALLKALGLPAGGYNYETRTYNHDIHDVIIKAGSILKVDRIYIRKGVGEYSSLTFNIQKGKGSQAVCNSNEKTFKSKGARFWAKLSDVNNMIVEVDTATLTDN